MRVDDKLYDYAMLAVQGPEARDLVRASPTVSSRSASAGGG